MATNSSTRSEEDFSTDEFNERRKLLFALGGVVALPSPTPASGQVFLGTHPQINPEDSSAPPSYYVKVVQRVSEKLVITRIVNSGDIRAVELPNPEQHREAVPKGRRRLVLDDPRVTEMFENTKQLLAGESSRAVGAREALLFDNAIIFVPESAPVLVRVLAEFGATAAEASENVLARIIRNDCACLVPAPVHDQS